LVVNGRFPLRRVSIRVVNYRDFNAFFSSHPLESDDEFMENRFARRTELGDVSPIGTEIIGDIGIDRNESTNKDYNIEIQAMNGKWLESLRFRKIRGHWLTAIKVVDLDLRRGALHRVVEKRVLKEEADPGFPSRNGKVNWDE
jgi:hypothetical protein